MGRGHCVIDRLNETCQLTTEVTTEELYEMLKGRIANGQTRKK